MTGRALLSLALSFAWCTPAVAAPCERDEGRWHVIACPQRSGARDYKADNGDVARRDLPDGGPNVAVFFGGWTAHDTYVRAWLDGLAAAGVFEEHQIGRLYAVPGPEDSTWSKKREIPWQVVAKEVGARPGLKLLLVAAHSSGAFVADTFLGGLLKQSPALLGRTALFKLDGGWTADLPKAQTAKLGAIACVTAQKTNSKTYERLVARNYCAMQTAAGVAGCPPGGANCGTWYGPKATLIVLDASHTACTAANCLHDAVVTTTPHDPANFDLADDYAKFDATHKPVTEWLERAAGPLAKLAR
jgi:hypothetical protein